MHLPLLESQPLWTEGYNQSTEISITNGRVMNEYRLYEINNYPNIAPCYVSVFDYTWMEHLRTSTTIISCLK